MTEKSVRAAIGEAMASEMRRDENVILIGEDVAGGQGCEGELDAFGGVLGLSKGLVHEFGTGRVIDTPISEMGYMGMAVGAAATGLRPIAELMFADFMVAVGICSTTRRQNSAICLEARRSRR